jgi:hypothetical protein
MGEIQGRLLKKVMDEAFEIHMLSNEGRLNLSFCTGKAVTREVGEKNYFLMNRP